jgi:hypothetical protein
LISEKKRVWDELSNVLKFLKDQLVILGGDFNAIIEEEEKLGGIQPNKKCMEDFKSFILENNLFDYKPSNVKITWTNRRKNLFQIAKRLDRFLLSADWLSSSIEFSSSILGLPSSDHFPILFHLLEDKAPRKIPFKFEPMWFRDSSFLPFI